MITDAETASSAIEAEKAGSNRKDVIAYLESLIE
jgi:hypothetical protein